MLRSVLIMSLVLAIPIVPFVLWNEAIESWVTQLRAQMPSPTWLATLVVALLASDIVLPIPSSFVCTWAGAEFGWLLGALLTWTGMTLGATLGFLLARQWGSRCVHWFTRPADLATIAIFAERHGAMLLALARGVPVVAEASVLWMGLHRLSWRAFFLAILPSNLVLACVYAWVGELAAEQEWLPMALAGSVALPIALLEASRRYYTALQRCG
jgi:uncharacterized membrane protein YdjX (TVP38/TMEM64 family)